METLLKLLTQAAEQADRAELREALTQMQEQAVREATYQRNLTTLLLLLSMLLTVIVIGLAWEQWKLRKDGYTPCDRIRKGGVACLNCSSVSSWRL